MVLWDYLVKTLIVGRQLGGAPFRFRHADELSGNKAGLFGV
jgi:hypothetical protein